MLVIFSVFAGPALAKTTAHYFEWIGNCDGGGGWVVIDDGGENGQGSVTILCDGGSVG